MKRTFLFLTCLIASLAMSIQLHAVTIENGYHKMLVEGKVWNYTHHTAEGDRPFYVEVKGDTMIDGNACKKVYVCMANSRQLYGSYYEYGNSVNAYLASDFKKNDGRWSLVEQPAGSASKDLYAFVHLGSFGYGYYRGTNGGLSLMGYIATRRAGITSADDACNWPSEVFPTCYDLVKTSTGIWGRAQLTYYRQLTPVETWVSGIGDSKWGILQPHHDAWQEGDERIEFESCSQDGQILFTKADFDAEALKADYKPFVEENKRWTCWRNPYGADLYYFYLKGDTIVDGRTCKKLYSQNEHNDGLTRYKGALYEQDRRVYRYLPGQTTAYLYFDFSLKPGEESGSMASSPTYTCYITMTSNLYELRDGQLYRMMAFVIRWGRDYSTSQGVWIEGVGPGYEEDLSDPLDFYVTGDGYGDGIIDCSVNGQSIYRTDRYSGVVGDDDHLDDYIPFVKEGKAWHVVSSIPMSKTFYSKDRYVMSGEVERDGKTYVRLHLYEGELGDKHYEAGLFREEGQRVYTYNEMEGREILMYDFSLKEGDTFTYELVGGIPETCKVLKQGWLDDGPKIVSYRNVMSADTLDAEYRHLRTWTIGLNNGAGGYYEVATWVEGAGTLENMFCPFCTGKKSSLAYLILEDTFNSNSYLPFPLYDKFNQLHGCNLPTGEADNSDWRHQLTYELEGDRLHVYGKAFTQCGPNNYAYFIEKPTDDPLVHKIEFVIQEVEPVADCKFLHAINIYVSGFDPNMNYIVVDNQGGEHPVINKTPQAAYRPMIEDGKVWKVGSTLIRDNLVKMVEYYYFDGDTVINNKTCKRMMCQRYVNPEYPDYAIVMHYPMLRYVGAWYEEDQKVYFATNNQVKLLYDFSANANDTIEISNNSYVVGAKQTGGVKGFKGVYRDILMGNYNTTWLEGVGGIDGPTVSVYLGEENHAIFLMSCTVGDEVIYFNDDYEDGATPESAEARKRIDFTHTIKIKPKSRRTIDVESLLYGEYNDLQLGINLNALDDAYLVHIADETGKTVYEKTVNAGNVVGLNIDISTYPKGRYTITVENSSETFTGRFETQPNGIEEVRSKSLETRGAIYNLQGQRLDTLQKGLNIVNGKKVIAK